MPLRPSSLQNESRSRWEHLPWSFERPSRTLSEELLHFENRTDGPYLIQEIRRGNHPHQRQRDPVDSAVEVETRKDEERNLDGKHCREKSGDRDGDGQLRGLHFGDSKLKSLSKASVLVHPEKW